MPKYIDHDYYPTDILPDRDPARTRERFLTREMPTPALDPDRGKKEVADHDERHSKNLITEHVRNKR